MYCGCLTPKSGFLHKIKVSGNCLWNLWWRTISFRLKNRSINATTVSDNSLTNVGCKIYTIWRRVTWYFATNSESKHKNVWRLLNFADVFGSTLRTATIWHHFFVQEKEKAASIILEWPMLNLEHGKNGWKEWPQIQNLTPPFLPKTNLILSTLNLKAQIQSKYDENILLLGAKLLQVYFSFACQGRKTQEWYPTECIDFSFSRDMPLDWRCCYLRLIHAANSRPTTFAAMKCAKRNKKNMNWVELVSMISIRFLFICSFSFTLGKPKRRWTCLDLISISPSNHMKVFFFLN